MIAQLRPHVRNRQLTTSGQHPVAKMARVEIPADVHEAVDEKHPGDGEVVVASPPAVAERPGLLPRKAPVREPERRRIAAIAGMPPVQLGEIEEDVDAAPQQIHAGDEVDPVTDADAVRVNGGGPRQRGESFRGSRRWAQYKGGDGDAHGSADRPASD